MSYIVIGVTGQTGAGKTTVTRHIEAMGGGVVLADQVAREVLAPGSDCLKRLAEIFGYDIIDSNGCCRRAVLAQRAFSAPEKTQLLNSITHPAIIERSRELIRNCAGKGKPVIVFDASQLYESGGDQLCHYVIAVTAPVELRLERILRRDGITRQAAMERILAQHDEEYYTRHADFVIDGAQPLQQVIDCTDRILQQLTAQE